MLEKLLTYDSQLLIYLNNLGSETYDSFWMFATHTATWTPLFILFLVLIYKNHTKKQTLIIVFTVLFTLSFTLLFTELIKEWIQRIRPNNTDELKTSLRILTNPTDYSFFSGHASNAMAVTLLIFFFLRKKVKYTYLFFLWPLLFSLSRIYLGVHYPSDIIIGSLVGATIAYIAYKISKPKIKPI